MSMPNLHSNSEALLAEMWVALLSSCMLFYSIDAADENDANEVRMMALLATTSVIINILSFRYIPIELHFARVY